MTPEAQEMTQIGKMAQKILHMEDAVSTGEGWPMGWEETFANPLSAEAGAGDLLSILPAPSFPQPPTSDIHRAVERAGGNGPQRGALGARGQSPPEVNREAQVGTLRSRRFISITMRLILNKTQ